MSEPSEPSVLKFPVTMVQNTCANCGIEFATPSHFEKTRREDHKSFFCPNGHSLAFSGVSDSDRIKSLTTKVERAKSAFARIAAIDVGLLNKASLELAIEIAANAAKAMDEEPKP